MAFQLYIYGLCLAALNKLIFFHYFCKEYHSHSIKWIDSILFSHSVFVYHPTAIKNWFDQIKKAPDDV